MVSGVSYTGAASSSDLDGFQIWAASGATLQISVTGPSSATVLVYSPTGAYYTGGSVTPTTPLTVSNLPQTGGWTWQVWPSTSTTYTTQGALTCFGGSCSTVLPTRLIRNAWGDQFAGQFATSTTAHDYEVALAAEEGISVSVTDAAPPCALDIAVIPPLDQLNLRPGGVQTEILHWTDGSLVRELSGANQQGAGGFIRAVTSGNYTFRVRQQTGTTCPWYRIQFARTQNPGVAMPQW